MTTGYSQSIGRAVASTPLVTDDSIMLGTMAQGDSAAVEALYDLHGSQCFGLALGLLAHDFGAAEDVVQEVFVRAWRSASSYDADRASVRTWLLRITRNACIDLIRRRAARPALEWDGQTWEAPAANDVWSEVAQSLTREDVRAALNALPVEQKRAIELAYFEGLTCDEIAQRTGVPLGTVKGRLRLALHKLRNTFRA